MLNKKNINESKFDVYSKKEQEKFFKSFGKYFSNKKVDELFKTSIIKLSDIIETDKNSVRTRGIDVETVNKLSEQIKLNNWNPFEENSYMPFLEKIKVGNKTKYSCIFGHHRLLAFIKTKQKNITAMVCLEPISEKVKTLIQLKENSEYDTVSGKKPKNYSTKCDDFRSTSRMISEGHLKNDFKSVIDFAIDMGFLPSKNKKETKRNFYNNVQTEISKSGSSKLSHDYVHSYCEDDAKSFLDNVVPQYIKERNNIHITTCKKINGNDGDYIYRLFEKFAACKDDPLKKNLFVACNYRGMEPKEILPAFDKKEKSFKDFLELCYKVVEMNEEKPFLGKNGRIKLIRLPQLLKERENPEKFFLDQMLNYTI